MRGCLEQPCCPRKALAAWHTSPRPPPRLTTFYPLHIHTNKMADDDEVNLYDEIEIEDCFYDETLQIYHHPCPCGDRFEISIADMRDGEDIARCPSCSLMIRIIFDPVILFLFAQRTACLLHLSRIFHQSPKTTPHRPLPSPPEQFPRYISLYPKSSAIFEKHSLFLSFMHLLVAHNTALGIR